MSLPPLLRLALPTLGEGLSMTDLRRCAYPPCETLFSPVSEAHHYCCDGCSHRHRKGITRPRPRCEWCDRVIVRSAGDRHRRRYHRACWAAYREDRASRADAALALARREAAAADHVVAVARQVIEVVIDGIVFERVWSGDTVSASGVKGGLLAGQGYEQSREAQLATSSARRSGVMSCTAAGHTSILKRRQAAR